MATSQNGWPARSAASHYVPLRWITGRVDPRVHALFDALCQRFHNEVEPIRQDWSWGWAFRTIRGASVTYSNHASGTAIDLNAPRHPLGRFGTFSAAQRRAIHSILHDFPEVRWGGDYIGRKDEMHFEINVPPSRYKGTIRGSGSSTPAPAPKPSGGTTGGKAPAQKRKGPSGQGVAATKSVQRFLRRTGHYTGIIDGDYGPLTIAAVQAYQSDQNKYGNAGLLVDGDWGQVTRSWQAWVKKLQRALPKFKGIGRLRVDGDYGNVTHQAVRTLQSRNGLYVDGFAETKTLTFMRRAGAKIPNRP